MTFEQWMLGCLFLLVAGYLAYALVTGRAGSAYSEATRSGDPVGYWLGIAILLVALGLLLVALRQEDGSRVPGAVFAMPIFLYALVQALRTGEARSFSKDPFCRADRPVVYWAHVAVLVLLLAFTTAVLAGLVR